MQSILAYLSAYGAPAVLGLVVGFLTVRIFSRQALYLIHFFPLANPILYPTAAVLLLTSMFGLISISGFVGGLFVAWGIARTMKRRGAEGKGRFLAGIQLVIFSAIALSVMPLGFFWADDVRNAVGVGKLHCRDNHPERHLYSYFMELYWDTKIKEFSDANTKCQDNFSPAGNELMKGLEEKSDQLNGVDDPGGDDEQGKNGQAKGQTDNDDGSQAADADNLNLDEEFDDSNLEEAEGVKIETDDQ